MIPTWVLLDDAADACEALLADTFGVALKQAPPDPLDSHGFELLLKQLFASLVRAVGPEDARALQGVQTVLDLDWPGMTSDARARAIAIVAKALGGVPTLVVGKVDQALAKHGPQIIAATKQKATAYYDLPIDARFNLVDQRVINAARTSQAHYIRNEYGKREAIASAEARAIVADGLERGLDRYAIAEELRPAMAALGVKRSYGYLRMVASVFAARARAWGSLAAFDEAGIEHMEWVSMLDESTSDVCRFLDGRIFPVAAARDRYLQVAASAAPEAVVELQPWVQAGRAKDGSVALFYKQGGERKPIALVERSGVGAADDRGEYSRAASTGKLIAAGITSPPAHAHCRSQIVPASAVPTRAQVPASLPVSGPSTTPNVLPYLGTGPLKPVIAGQAATEQELAALARAGRALPAGFNPEALPELTAAEIAAQQAAAAKQKAIADALAALAALPSGMPGKVLHGIPDLKTSGVGDPPKNPTKVQLAGAKMQKSKQALVKDVWTLFPNADAKAVEEAIRAFDPAHPITVFKHDGKLWAPGEDAKNHVIAAKLLGHAKLQVKIIDQDAAAAKQAWAKGMAVPPALVPVMKAMGVSSSAPTAAPPAVQPKGDAKNILHQQTGGPKGSNEGGFYAGADGVERYVKFYDDPAQAHCEHLSNALYAALGHTAPASTLFEHKGKTAYASILFKGGKTLKDIGGPSAMSNDDAKALMRAFAADVLTGNWDAVGTGFDNVMRLPDGRWARIDNGGTLLMRAKEGRKPAAALDAITEWDVFFSSKNPYYQQVAARAGYSAPEDFKDEVTGQIRRILELQKSAGSWADYVRLHIPDCPAADRDRIAQMLSARSRLLEEKLAEITKPVPAAGGPRFLAKQYSTISPAKGLRLADLPETTVIEDHYGKISRNNPTRMPSGESYDSYRRRAEAAVKDIKGAELKGIISFTGTGYTAIRESEELGLPNPRSDAIQRALEKGTPEPGTVWRGIRGLPEAVITKHLENGVLQLGKKGGATSSTAWCVDVSIDSFMGGPGDGHPGGYKILYKLHGKTQVPVETISSVGATERELMMKRDTVFRVTGLSRAKGRKHVLVVEAEEILGEEAVQAREHAARGGGPLLPAAPGPGPATPPPKAPGNSVPVPGPPPKAPVVGAPAPPPPTATEVTAAIAKLAAMPKTQGDMVAHPSGSPHFNALNPVPVPPKDVPQAKFDEAKKGPVMLVDPSSVTMHSDGAPDDALEMALNLTLIMSDWSKFSVTMIKAGGKLYTIDKTKDHIVGAFALLGMPVPAHIVDLD